MLESRRVISLQEILYTLCYEGEKLLSCLGDHDIGGDSELRLQDGSGRVSMELNRANPQVGAT